MSIPARTTLHVKQELSQGHLQFLCAFHASCTNQLMIESLQAAQHWLATQAATVGSKEKYIKEMESQEAWLHTRLHRVSLRSVL